MVQQAAHEPLSDETVSEILDGAKENLEYLQAHASLIRLHHKEDKTETDRREIDYAWVVIMNYFTRTLIANGHPYSNLRQLRDAVHKMIN
ncbi:hypothetical protein J7399_03275 [Shimia sp. R9_1]|uniref:hypothetical protein n=1 Tax=Shimia sp. R9_1 TaxID=2821111 RepID=UPI001ADB0F2E|nr:hypothetical protein [Shimia sp. R9_1]MBO9406439.1 hypothetical protein [Shimia sp. R9_1]